MEGQVLRGLAPEKVFAYFEALTRIPRGSGNERAVSDYLLSFAEAHGYEWARDAHNNVKMWIPATAGYEGRKTIALQAHVDMVCTAEAGVDFDFATDPIDIYVEDGFVKARGTTLGADDGAGVALILALLEDDTLPHPPLQAIFTTGEEIMLLGAEGMEDAWLDSDYFIGLDYSNNEKILVSAAGISVMECTLPLQWREIPEPWAAFHLKLHGLQGGHSGNAIHLPRGNSLKVMEELLTCLEGEEAFLAQLAAGTLINVIPSTAEAVVVCKNSAADAVEATLRRRAAELQADYREREPQLTITVEQRAVQAGQRALSKDCQEKLLAFVRHCYAGAWRMAEGEARAECSANPAILRLEEEAARCTLSARSNSEGLHDEILAYQQAAAENCGWRAEIKRRAGAWEYDPDSVLLPQVKEIFTAVTGRAAEIARIHAGVEGGVFAAKARRCGRRLDMVNLGCMTYDVHTPRERLEIASVGTLYEILRRILMTVE